MRAENKQPKRKDRRPRRHLHVVWGRETAYKWLWVAALVAGWDAARRRYEHGKVTNG
jgi:hypothetical protein